MRNAVFIAIALLPAAAGAEMVDKPAPHVGDCWTYRQTDLSNDEMGRSKYCVAALSDTTITATQEDTSGQPNETMTLDRSGNTTRSGDKIWEPSNLAHLFPAIGGETWSGRMRVKNGKAGPYQSCLVQGKVLPAETVTVPAGTFQALRFESEVECWDTSTKTAGFTVKILNIRWYAPEINNNVMTDLYTFSNGRIRSKVNSQLITYTPSAN